MTQCLGRCAIGHLLPLETITSHQKEGKFECIEYALNYRLLPSDLLEFDQAENEALKGRNAQDDVYERFIGKMQVCHDRGDTPENMQERFQKLGTELGLNWPLPV